MENFSEQLKRRTKAFTLEIIKLCQAIPYSAVNSVLIKQLTKSGTSVAANYRAAARARSEAEFYSKLCIVVEEADESLFWLEVLIDAQIVKLEEVAGLIKESEEILKIMVSIKNKTKNKLT
jgi:four helix bundle protein